MSYFDPTEGKFKTVETLPIPIQVRPADRVSIPNGGGSATGARGTLTPLVESSEGLLANETSPDRVLGSQTAVVGPGTWGVFLGTPLVYAAAWLSRRKTLRLQTDDALRRRSKAYKTARHALHSADGDWSPGRARTALVGYIADRCNAPREGMTRMEAVRIIQDRKAPPEAVQAVDRYLELLEQAEYGRSTTTAAPQSAMTLLDVLERCRLR